MEDIRYPIGHYVPEPYSEERKEAWLADLRFLPQALEGAILNLNEDQLHTPYRPEGWTVHQVVHHVADSHLHGYTRFKHGFTKDCPAICPYDQNLWAVMEDVKALPVNISLTLLFALHARWDVFLSGFSASDFEIMIYHPEHKRTFTLWALLGQYAWHGRHHVAQITALRARMEWYG